MTETDATDATEEAADLAEFRARARAFLAEHAPIRRRRPDEDGPPDRGLGDVAGAKRYQAALFDAGLAGITWPEPWGLGLSSEHTRVFNEEAAGRELPTAIYTIGLGSGTAETLMKQIATGPEYYFFAPANEQLAAIYNQIALIVANFSVRNIGLGDDLGVNGPFVAGSGAPAPGVAGDVLSWSVASLTEAPAEWVYEIKPTKVGLYPAADRTAVSYVDLDGETREFVLTQPNIEVLEPQNARACSDGPPRRRAARWRPP